MAARMDFLLDLGGLFAVLAILVLIAIGACYLKAALVEGPAACSRLF